VANALSAALFGVARWFARATRLFQHLAAGMLRVADLRDGIARTWEDVAASDAAVAAGLMDWEELFVGRFLTRGGAVLLVGSGPGRDLVALAARGYRVTAVEPARRANQTARRHLAARGLAAEIVEGFFEDVTIEGTFDAVVFSYCCYSFIPDSRRRVAALRKAAEHLAAGAPIVVSYLTARSGHPLLMRLARATAAISGSDWRPEPGDILHAVDTTAPRFHYEHAFTADEIEEEARRAGLRPIDHRAAAANPVVVLTVARGSD
jgi:SAM-dependent methyltransferase